MVHSPTQTNTGSSSSGPSFGNCEAFSTDTSAVTRQRQDTSLLGKNEREYAEIIRWMSLVNSEVQPNLANWFKPLIHRRAYDEANVERARNATNRAVAIVESHFASRGSTFLVGESLTLADLFAVSSFSRGFQYVFDKDWQQQYPCVTKWFKHVVEQPIWRKVVPEPVFVKEAVRYWPKADA